MRVFFKNHRQIVDATLGSKEISLPNSILVKLYNFLYLNLLIHAPDTPT